MTTKELLALVGVWITRGDSLESGAMPTAAAATRLCADELAPIATALCAEVEAQALRIAQQDATIARLRGALGFFMVAAYPVCTTINPRGHNWSEAYLDQAFVHARITMEGQPSSRRMAAELMRSVLPDECEYRGPNSGATAGEVRGYNTCRTETLARIEAWQNQEQGK